MFRWHFDDLLNVLFVTNLLIPYDVVKGLSSFSCTIPRCCCCCFLRSVQSELDIVAKHRAPISSNRYLVHDAWTFENCWTVIPVHLQLLLPLTFWPWLRLAKCLFPHHQSWNPNAGCRCWHRKQKVVASFAFPPNWLQIYHPSLGRLLSASLV